MLYYLTQIYLCGYTGTVDAYKDLACEVVWHPSYLAPEDGSFSLMVHGGNTLQLQCKAEVGQSAGIWCEQYTPWSVQYILPTFLYDYIMINSNNNIFIY